MSKKCNTWVSKTKYYLKELVFEYIDLGTNKKILLFPDKCIMLLYPMEKMCPNIPIQWFYPLGDSVKFYCGIQYVLKYNLQDDIYFHHTIAQMVNIYQESLVRDVEIIKNEFPYLILPVFFRRDVYRVMQYRSLFPPLAVNPNTNIYYKYEDKNKRRIYDV